MCVHLFQHRVFNEMHYDLQHFFSRGQDFQRDALGPSAFFSAGGQPREHSWLPNEEGCATADTGSDQPSVPAFHPFCLQVPCESSASFMVTSGRSSQVLSSLAEHEPQVDPESLEQAQKYPETYLSHPCVCVWEPMSRGTFYLLFFCRGMPHT